MKNNNSSHSMRCNIRWLLRLSGSAVLGIFLSGLLSGCHPCSWSGNICSDSFQTINAYIDDQKQVYFDIPIRTQYNHVDLEYIQIRSIKNGFATNTLFWSIKKKQKPFSERQKTVIVSDLPIPIHYGQIVLDALIDFPPQPLENGHYAILGRVTLYEEEHKISVFLSGRFSYENGTVRNLTSWDN